MDHCITELLQLAGAGDAAARERVWSHLYAELHRLAQQQMSNEPVGQTLQPTALIHEAYLRLFNGQDFDCQSREHFFALAAKVMRQIRVDAARRRKRIKRGGNNSRQDLDHHIPVFEEDPTELLAIHDALEKLQEHDPAKALLVELRYFAGLSVDQCSSLMGVSARTFDNQWRLARAWLWGQLADKGLLASRTS